MLGLWDLVVVCRLLWGQGVHNVTVVRVGATSSARHELIVTRDDSLKNEFTSKFK